jgi:hypothetical protein
LALAKFHQQIVAHVAFPAFFILVTDNVVPYCRVMVRDGAKLDGSFTSPVSRTPTLGVVQEQSQYLPDTQEEDKAALRQLGIADRKVFDQEYCGVGWQSQKGIRINGHGWRPGLHGQTPQIFS